MVDFFAQQQDFSQDSERLLAYAQLCTVFYERELKLLADCQYSPERLRKRLTSLPFYIKRAAESLIALENPLTLDTQNGTWSSKQKRRCPADKIDDELNGKWLSRNAQIGLIVPVKVVDTGVVCFKLDCIDAVSDEKIRLNEHGWFALNGHCLEQCDEDKRVLKANKDTMSAAACGHQWIGGDMTFPRTLTLRELLLTTVINWPNLNKPMPLTH
ncbi:hypothetical protein [Catenovulum sediminis]|uniref:Uncharacterized protein n=1 Tax=Catenovulum sediminis TaxID=1740262 RepID=A0ABV1RGV9_9ALTE|nr:hypothetical protein [Catenovulum sediminis]